MKTRYSVLYLSLISILFFACEKDVVIGAEEPDLNNGDEPGLLTDFELETITIDNRTVYFSWEEVPHAASYDLVVSNGLIIRDIGKQALYYEKVYYYELKGLLPDTPYKITIKAYDKDFKLKTSSALVRTLKNFFDEILSFEPDRYRYDAQFGFNYSHHINTSDGGHAVVGSASIFGTYHTLLIKLTDKYEIAWIAEVPNDKSIWVPYEPTYNLEECRDGGFLITSSQHVMKISATGTLLWNNGDLVAVANVTDHLSWATELPDGSVVAVGYSKRSWGDHNVGVEFLIMRLDTQGQVVWKRYGGHTIENSLTHVLYTQSGKLLACGTIDSAGANFESLTSIKKQTVMLEYDMDGNILAEYKYPYNEDPYIRQSWTVNFLESGDQSLYIVAAGNSSHHISSHVLKVRDNGEVIWELKGHDHTPYYDHPKLANVINENALLLLNYTDPWYEFKEISEVGVILHSERMGNISNGFFIDKDDVGRYIYITQHGEVAFINPGGYRQQ